MKRLLSCCLLALAWSTAASAQTDVADSRSVATVDPAEIRFAMQAAQSELGALFVHLTTTKVYDHDIIFSGDVNGTKCTITMSERWRKQEPRKKYWLATNIQCER